MKSDTHVDNSDMFPPLAPDGGETVSSDAEFAAACLSKFKDYLAALNIRSQVVSESRTWGTLLRLDVDVPGYDPAGRVNRVVCWRDANGIYGIVTAVAQGIPPLDVGSANGPRAG